MQPQADHHGHDHDDQSGHDGHGHRHGHDDHDHDHGHRGHAHGPGHVHAPASFGRAFVIGIALNAAFVVAEVVFGLASHSVALLADAGHNLSDVLGLLVAGGAHALTRRAPTGRFTYGFGSSSILAALFNAVFLLVVIGGLSWEAITRFAHPEPVAAWTVMAVATDRHRGQRRSVPGSSRRAARATSTCAAPSPTCSPTHSCRWAWCWLEPRHSGNRLGLAGPGR